MIEGVVDSKEIEGYLEKFPEETLGAAKILINAALFRADARVKKNFKGPLNSRTGALKRSIGHSTTGMSIDKIHGSLYSKANVKGTIIKYAPIHEYGGEIKAKNAYKKLPGGPYLNIPAPANLTPAGVQRRSAKSVFQAGGIIPKGKKVVLLNGEIMFYLVKKVDIPARLGMRKAADDEVPSLLADLAEAVGDY